MLLLRCTSVAAATMVAVGQPQQQKLPFVDTAEMWRELDSHCKQGRCSLSEGSQLSAAANTTDCKGRMLAYEYGLKLLPGRAPQLESFDALQLESTCGVTRPAARTQSFVPTLAIPFGSSTFVVDSALGDDDFGNGTMGHPFRTVNRALGAARASQTAKRSIVLKPGVHYLQKTIELGAADSGTTITAPPGATPGSVVVSGGELISPIWTKSTRPGSATNATVWETPVSASLAATGFLGLTTLDPHRRVTRARFPNAGAAEGAELCTHGCWANGIKEWHKNTSCVAQATVIYKDLRDCDDEKKLPDGSPCKNDSAMFDTYNTYSNGHGGCCAAWSGDQSPYGPMGNYFCGNASAGGWVGFNDPRGDPGDPGYNGTQGLSAQLPWGFNYDPEAFPLLDTMAEPAGAILHVWSHGWFVNMFEVAKSDADANTVSASEWL
eukprot:COSAG05_NODE_122_length_17611_cov_47.044655_11_plen_437_part_00